MLPQSTLTEARGKVNVVDSIMERIENVRKTGFADEIIIEDHEDDKRSRRYPKVWGGYFYGGI